MEKAGFILTIAAGLGSCVLLTWQAQVGPQADWVPGFLCALWSLLMMARLLTLTAAPQGPVKKNHLAARIIHALDQSAENRRRNLLQQSLGIPYMLFLGMGIALLGWQIFCAVFSSNNYRIEGFAQAVTSFFAGHAAAAPMFGQAVAFEWGQGFLYFLCLAMMGFLLRSYAALVNEVRITLLILAAYVVAGWITFFGLTLEGFNPSLDAALVGYGPAAGVLGEGKTLFDRILMESGTFGVAFMAFILCIPFGFIGMASAGVRRDRITALCGLLAGFALVFSVFLAISPALGGFIFLCWMAVFLAWGRSEAVLFTKTA